MCSDSLLVMCTNIQLAMDGRNVSITLLVASLGFISTECCILSMENKSANCSRLGLKVIPPNLPRWVIHIDLSYNIIEKVDAGDFSRLLNLRSINLDNNKISRLEREAFVGLVNLEELSLDSNNLVLNNNSFVPGVFKPLRQLKSLKIRNNIKNCYSFTGLQHYPDRDFSFLRNLKRLSLDLYRLPMFGKGFKRMVSLQTLTFDQCCLHDLTNNTFENLPSSITEIHMTNCKYISTNVGNNAFKTFKNLKILNLRLTPMSLASAIGLLYPLQNMSMDVIDFSLVKVHHQFSVILTKSMFSNLKTICVKKLDLSFNAIVKIGPGSLISWGSHTKCLEHIILSGNAFHLAYDAEFDLFILLASHYQDLKLKIFEYSYAAVEFPYYYQSDVSERNFMQNPKHSDIIQGSKDQGHSLDILATKTFFDCKFWNKNHLMPRNLHTLRISHIIAYLYFCNYTFPENSLRFIDISYSLVDNLYLTVTGLENVTYFDASGIDFTKASPSFMKSISNVTSLILQNVELDRVFINPTNRNMFNYNSKVKNLNLSHNHLTDLPENMFQNMKYLENLNLSYNSLDKFPSQILDKESLTVVDLSYNRIMGLNKDIIESLDAFTLKLGGRNLSIHLHGNAFLCTCDYMHFVQWTYDTKIKLDNDGNYICTLSNGTRSTTKTVREHLREIFSECKSTIWLTFSIIFVCVFMLILIGSVICFRLRWRIQYFFYRHLHYGYKPIRNDDSVYTYDAFVAYSGEDYRWITSTFREKLETGHSLKLCLHDRDFEPGRSIQQNIINSICNSRKVIIDATPGYIKSKWFEFEIEMANIEMMDRSYEDGIIVIIRNGTKPNDMPDLLRRLWDNITCVLLEDAEDENIFFERVVTALDD